MKKLIRLFRHLLHEFVVHLMPKSMTKNVLSCQQVTEMLLHKEDFDKKTLFKLRVHLLICQCCTDYQGQIDFINQEAKRAFNIELGEEQKALAKKIQNQVLKKHNK